ncbi:hypothetical protein RE428_27330 [Marinobacter nanhaiticus D15-8W]|nr:hypothetical protein RE428_27330 [Marinobacter nanhaiticus D15-8W]
MVSGGEPAVLVILDDGCIQDAGKVGVRNGRQFNRGNTPIERHRFCTDNT